MTNISKLAAIAAVAISAIASPAFAQSFDPEVGSGNVQSFNSAPIAPRNGTVAVRHPGRVIAVRRNGLHALAAIPGGQAATNANSPALTGGGSLGYNQQVLQPY